MNKDHLNILHLSHTGISKLDDVCQARYGSLIGELIEQDITHFKLWEGEYDPLNTKQAIHKGHRKIVQYAKDNKLPMALIAEDDLKFSHPNSFKYFVSEIPKSFDVFSALVYSAEMQENRILNGGSGMTTLYAVHNRFYDFFLSMNLDNHVDRELALTAYKHEYYVVQPMVLEQRGGFSFNRNESLFYGEYLRDVKLYGAV